ncbi:MAG: AmmeMemoRadiSam system radical SAM enzyme, partial [Deltaproteobacteria bacterium]|nr:AmmeMemoRadiSam system radical SAM enzyme [Deltaproteobacteria bacterium]MBW2694637.1 AmmeMemoRadiSam system radical SAM enzyme [Deltaproteobacteria bacterium]
HGCRSVAYTYNDPVIFLEYAVDVAQACRELGLKSVAVTAGYICDEPRREFFGSMDAANIDLKAFTDDFYQKVCGGRLDPVLETLRYLKHETEVWFEITTLLIPGENDSEAEIDAASRWIAENLGPDVPWHFTAFHPDYRMLDRDHTPVDVLRRSREIARSYGIRYVYTGNVRDRSGGSTLCHECGECLIGRDGYTLTHWGLSADGLCSVCRVPCSGVFESTPGDWGSRRLPVRLRAGH